MVAGYTVGLQKEILVGPEFALPIPQAGALPAR